jgi:hypothetical protein
VTCTDLVIQKSIEKCKIVLVQEGMTDPENYRYHLVKSFGFPRFLANTSMIGLSDAYVKFCVASEGFKELLFRKGVKREKMVVTGIPNFDNCQVYLDNDFPHRDYVLAATSHLRETFKYENRKKFIRKVLDIADGRQVIFKLHPNEDRERRTREIKRYAPDALVYASGNTNHMIANSSALVTRYSSVLLVALALGKTLYSDLDPEFARTLTPLQTNGTSAKRIAHICEEFLQ